MSASPPGPVPRVAPALERPGSRQAARGIGLAVVAALAGGVATAALILVLGGSLRSAQAPASPPLAPPPASDPEDAGAAAQASVDASRRTAIVAAADRVGRSVVAIYALSTQQANPYAGTIWEDFFPFFRQPLPVQSLGSGFIYSPEGHVITNHHVVRDADSVHVTLMDGRSFPARIVGTEATTDLAVLEVQRPAGGEPLPAAPIGSSANLLIGEWAIAIGNPFAPLLADANPSVTVGVISALHRDVRPEPGQEQIWTDMIQTDASINPGNSGGPLVNAEGQVVAVNSFIFSRTGGSIGIGFAIPIDRVRRIADDLIGFGEVRLSWLGIHVADVPSAVAAPDAPRVVVERVDPGSPAAEAGLEPGDALLATNGRRVLSELDWEGRQIDFRSDAPVRLELVRDGRPSSLEITPAADPLSTAREEPAPLGLRLTPLTAALRSYLGATAESGLLVTAVAPGSPAQNIGLRQGDVILAIDDRRVSTVEEGAALLRELSNRPRASLVWERAGRLFRWEG